LFALFEGLEIEWHQVMGKGVEDVSAGMQN
jgi:hypothetical protein